MVKGNTAFLPSTEFHEQHSDEMRFLAEKLAMVENQLIATQAQVKERDREAVALRQEIQEMGDRNRMLEQVVGILRHRWTLSFLTSSFLLTGTYN